MYGDALISAAIIMFILPVVLSIFWMATLTVYRAYYWDHILQDTITYLEVAKASYYKNGAIETGVYNSQFTMSPSEKITYKIRDHSVNKVPYLIVVGDKEKNANTVAVRARGGVDLGVMTVEELMARMENEIQSKQ